MSVVLRDERIAGKLRLEMPFHRHDTPARVQFAPGVQAIRCLISQARL